jgi:hypothetical protein
VDFDIIDQQLIIFSISSRYCRENENIMVQLFCRFQESLRFSWEGSTIQYSP